MKTLLNPKYTLNNYIINEANRGIVNSISSVVFSSKKSCNPIFIYGQNGVGKTHLLQAITHQLIASNIPSRVFYTTTENFINDLISSIEDEAKQNFNNFYQDLDVLLIDDIHFLMGKKSTQIEFYLIIKNLIDNDKLAVVTADRSLQQIFTDLKQLNRIFLKGMVLKITIPNYKSRLSFLVRRAQELGLELPFSFLNDIAYQIQTDFCRLEGTLLKLKLQNDVIAQPI